MDRHRLYATTVSESLHSGSSSVLTLFFWSDMFSPLTRNAFPWPRYESLSPPCMLDNSPTSSWWILLWHTTTILLSTMVSRQVPSSRYQMARSIKASSGLVSRTSTVLHCTVPNTQQASLHSLIGSQAELKNTGTMSSPPSSMPILVLILTLSGLVRCIRTCIETAF